jgi:hypothetical protein
MHPADNIYFISSEKKKKRKRMRKREKNSTGWKFLLQPQESGNEGFYKLESLVPSL